MEAHQPPQGPGLRHRGIPRRGYRLLAIPDKLLPEEISQGLKTRYLKGPIHHFETLPSTNDLAKELGARGRRKAPWWWPRPRPREGAGWAAAGNLPPPGLYVSLLLRPPLPPTEMPQITLTTAVAVVRALRRATGLTPGLNGPMIYCWMARKWGAFSRKWRRKPTGSAIWWWVWDSMSIIPDSRRSLKPPPLPWPWWPGGTFSRLQILQAWLEEFEDLYGRFLAREFPDILEEWKKYTVTLGRRSQCVRDRRKYAGGPGGGAGRGLAGPDPGRGDRPGDFGEIAPGPEDGAGAEDSS